MSSANSTCIKGSAVAGQVRSAKSTEASGSIFDTGRSFSGYGRRRTNREKHQAVVAVLNDQRLCRDENGNPLSDREIARLCRVSRSTVGRIRKELSGRIVHLDTKRLVKRGGTVYVQNTANIGRANRRRHRQGRPPASNIPAGTPTTYLECPNDPALAARTILKLMGADYVRGLCQSLHNHFSQKGPNTMISSNSTSTEPRVTLMHLSPSMAENWLSNANIRNRKVNDAHVKRLAKDMKEGHWIHSHEGIAFDPNGVLLDGQHRLWAIFMSGVTIPMYVWTNVSTEALLVIGSDKPRSIADMLRLAGKNGEVNKNDVSVLRAMLAGMRGYVSLSVQEASTALSHHREAIGFAIKHLPSIPIKGICNAVTRAVLARAYYSVNHEKLSKFAEMLTTGIVLDAPAARPMVALRQYLLVFRGNSSSERCERYGKTQRALMAFLHDEPISRLVSAGRELFPLPEEIQN